LGFFVVFKEQVGFEAWGKPDPFGGNGAINIASVMVAACFAFAGTELVGITAGEAANPKQSVPRAINGTFWRITIFYILSITVIGLLLSPETLASIKDQDDLLKSPFVLGLKRAGIPAADHIMNFIALIAVFSAANSSVYASSRTLMALAKEGQGPAIFGQVTKNGVPLNASLVTAIFGAVSFLSSFVGNGELFDWLVNLSGSYVIVTWMMICWAHIRFRKAYVLQGYKIKDLPYVSIIGTVGDYCGLVLLTFIIVLSGTADIIFAGAEFDTATFLYDYVGLIFFPIVYYTYKFRYGSKTVPLEEMDLITGNIHSIEVTIEAKQSKVSKWI